MLLMPRMPTARSACVGLGWGGGCREYIGGMEGGYLSVREKERSDQQQRIVSFESELVAIVVSCIRLGERRVWYSVYRTEVEEKI